MRRFSRRYTRPVIIALLIAALLTATLVPGIAAGMMDPQATPLIQCHVGLFLPLLLVGLATLGGLSRAERKIK